AHASAAVAPAHLASRKNPATVTGRKTKRNGAELNSISKRGQPAAGGCRSPSESEREASRSGIAAPAQHALLVIVLDELHRAAAAPRLDRLHGVAERGKRLAVRLGHALVYLDDLRLVEARGVGSREAVPARRLDRFLQRHAVID